MRRVLVLMAMLCVHSLVLASEEDEEIQKDLEFFRSFQLVKKMPELDQSEKEEPFHNKKFPNQSEVTLEVH